MISAARAWTVGVLGRLFGTTKPLLIFAGLHAYASWTFFVCAGVARWRLWCYAEDPTSAQASSTGLGVAPVKHEGLTRPGQFRLESRVARSF